jgi:hypothetical protein
MICVHLKELFQLCQENEIRLSSSDLVRVVCQQCGAHEVCPSALTSEFTERANGDEPAGGLASSAGPASTTSTPPPSSGS